MRRISILFVMILLLAMSLIMTACGNKATEGSQSTNGYSDNTEPTVSENAESDPLSNVALDDITLKEIEDAFAEEGNSITWFDINKENSKWDGVRCYGDFNGCVVLFEPGQLTVESEITVADCKFEYPNSFGLYGYYEGALYTLSEAFENGYISKDDVAVAAEHHRMLEEVI